MPPKFFQKFILLLFILAFVGALTPATCTAQWGRPSFGFNDYWGEHFEWMPPYFMPSFSPLFPYQGLTTTDDDDDDDANDPVRNRGVAYQVQKMAVQGDYLCVIYEQNGFDIWEDAPVVETGLAVFAMSEPNSPQLIGRVALPSDEEDTFQNIEIEEMILVDDLAFVFQKYPAIFWVIDLMDPTDPQILNFLTFEDVKLTHLAVGDDLVCLALYGPDKEENGIYILDLNSSQEPEIFAFFPIEDKVGTLLMAQNYLYVFGQNSEEGFVFDLQADKPELPCGTLDVPGESVVMRADRLYLATGQAEIQSRLHILNMGNLAQPELQESVNLLGREKQVFLQDEYLLVWKSSVFDSRHYLEILHIDAPEDSPKKVSTISFSQRPKSLACEENYLYILRENGLRVLDLSDPNEPVWGDVINLSSYLQGPEAEETDLILEEPTSDDDNDDDEYAPYPWDFPINPYFPYGPGFFMGGGYPPYGLSQSRGYGYGSAFASSAGPYGYSRGYTNPLLGLDLLPYSGSGLGSYEDAVGGLPYGLNSFFPIDCGPLDLPFWLFSGSD